MDMRSEKGNRAEMRLVLLYSEIGTAPMYAFRYAIGESRSMGPVSQETILGMLSLMIWILLIYVTIKGMAFLTRINNKSAGGPFSLYLLSSARKARMFIPAALGGATLLTNAVIVPAMSFMAAADGLHTVPSAALSQIGPNALSAVTTLILTMFFLFQWFYEQGDERFPGTVMLVWLLLIGAAGGAQTVSMPETLKALNPILGFRYLHSLGIRKAFQVLGILFLASAGTEMLYAGADPACRKTLIRICPSALLCVCLSYLGQGAWLLGQTEASGRLEQAVTDPFFQMLPAPLRIQVIGFSFAAVWAAAQAVISKAFSLTAEAIGTDFLPPITIRQSGPESRNLYIPAVNFQMWLMGCFFIWLFRSPERLAPVYALAAVTDMLTATIMLAVCCPREGGWKLSHILLACFGSAECVFLISNLGKLQMEGLAAVSVMLLLFLAMLAWNRGIEIEKKYSSRLSVQNYLSQLRELHDCEEYPIRADHLVYFEHEGARESVDEAVLYSILEREYKRALFYWFVSIHPSGEPYTLKYELERFQTDFVFRLDLELGYRCHQPITKYLRDIFEELDRQGIFGDRQRRPYQETGTSIGSFCYCLIRRKAEIFESMSASEIWALRVRNILQELTGVREEWFADADTEVLTERIPLMLMQERRRSIHMERADWTRDTHKEG